MRHAKFSVGEVVEVAPGVFARVMSVHVQCMRGFISRAPEWSLGRIEGGVS